MNCDAQTNSFPAEQGSFRQKAMPFFFTVVYCLLSSSIHHFTGRCFLFCVVSVSIRTRSREMADNASCMVFRRRSNWQKMTTKLAKHFSWKAHKAALADFYTFAQDPSNVDMSCIFSGYPVWMHTQSNTTNIIFTLVHNTYTH